MDISGVVSENNALYDRLLGRMWLVLAAFFVGRCHIFGISPFMIGFFIAICILDERRLACGIAIALGIVTNLQQPVAIRYIAMLAGILLVDNVIRSGKYRVQRTGSIIAMSAVSLFVNLCWHFAMPESINIAEGVTESVLVFSLAVIYFKAIKIIINDYVQIAVENEAAISAVLLAATVLCGMPLAAGGRIVIAEAFSLFSIIYAMYRFGFGIGISWTTIAGLIMSVRTGNEELLTNWLLVAVAAFAILCMLKGGRLVYGLTFAAVYYAAGALLYGPLLAEDSQKALLSALLIFLLLPAAYVTAIDERIKTGELEKQSSEWARLVMNRVENLGRAFKRIDYTMAKDEEAGIGFADVGDIISDFTNTIAKQVPLRKTIESRIIEELACIDISVKSLTLIKNKDGRYELYIAARCMRGRIVVAERVRQIVEKHVGIRLVLREDTRAIVGKNYELIGMVQKPDFACHVSVKTLSRYKNEISGDNFYVGDINDGRKLFMIADGMGNGARASEDSHNLLDALEELLMAGFDREMSIRIVNAYLSQRNKGERFATLDMLLMDLYTGYISVYKHGAAATFIKRDQWIEVLKSTSLPMGIVEGADFESCQKKLYIDDIVVMISDGVMDGIILENKEEYMRDIIMKCEEYEPEELADEIIGQLRSVGGEYLSDDATIIVIKLVKSL